MTFELNMGSASLNTTDIYTRSQIASAGGLQLCAHRIVVRSTVASEKAANGLPSLLSVYTFGN